MLVFFPAGIGARDDLASHREGAALAVGEIVLQRLRNNGEGQLPPGNLTVAKEADIQARM